MRPAVTLLAPLTLVLASCEAPADNPEVTDLRVPVPEPDDAYVDLVTPDQEVPAGEDRMYCYYLDNADPDYAVSEMEAYQGDYGHHIVLLTTTAPRPSGTFEDCTDPAAMSDFRSFVLPGTPLDPGYGILVPQGLQFVMQIHYVNASSSPILVRDVARLKKVDMASVTHWTTTFTSNSRRLQVPAGQTSRESFDCALPESVELLVVGGHMHEKGAAFRLEAGPADGPFETLYYVDPWRPEYRDVPPVTLLFDEPKPLSAGTVVRTTCEWDNDLAEDLAFPEEMCAGFGYIAGTQAPVHCEPA